MANSSGDSLNAHNSNPTVNPTSEVGSVPVITMQEHMTIMYELIQKLAPKPNAEPIKIVLPHFNPEIADVDSAEWCAATNLLMKSYPLQDSALVSALNNALKGSAAHWFTQIVTSEELTWPVFKKLFMTRFGGKDTVISTLINIFREEPQKGENMAAFAIRLRSLLKTKWQNATMAEVINAIILYRVSPEDQHIEQVALEKDIQTEDQFLSEMRVLALARRPTSSTSNTSTGPEAKRHKLPDSRNKCLYSDVFGHKIAKCRRRAKIEKRKERDAQKETNQLHRPCLASSIVNKYRI